MKASDLSKSLNSQVEAVCKYLLPGGRRKQFEYVTAGLQGGKGESMKVRLNAEDASRVGVWSDFATGESGKDLLDLWMAVRHCGLRQAMKESASWAGISADWHGSKPQKEWSRPEKPACKTPKTAAMEWLKGRGFTEDTIKLFKLAETASGEIVFPYLKDGEFINAKYRKLPKQFRQESNAEPCLFGWDTIEAKFPNERYVIITEGEMDSISLVQLGFPALSVPMGGGSGAKHNWILSDYDDLERFDRIYLCMDADGPGQEATTDIIKRLGEDRCLVVELPKEHKDANEWLMAGMTREDFENRLRVAKSKDPSELRNASEFTEQVIQLFEGEDLSLPPMGVAMPWASWDRNFRARDGELTILGGFNGHGKSALISNIMAHSLMKNEKWCVASMEMQPRRTLYRLVKQMMNDPQPNRDEIADLLKRLKETCWIFDVLGQAKANRMLEVFGYAAKRYGITNFVIDSLAKCGVDDEKDRPNQQKKFVEQLCDLKNRYSCHVWLLSHTRKKDSERDRPHKMDVKGDGAITDLAENLMFCWRDKDAEENGMKHDGIVQNPTSYVYIEKQRNFQFEGELPLYYDENTMRYIENLQERQAPWMPEGNY